MDDTATEPDAQAACSACGGTTRPDVINLAIWSASGLVVVENVPALVCNACAEQAYAEDVSSALRHLASAGFPRDRRKREMVVPVFALDLGKDGGTT